MKYTFKAAFLYILLIYCYIGHAQTEHPNHAKDPKKDRVCQKQTLVIKLKPEAIKILGKIDHKNPLLEQAGIKIKSIDRLFPDAEDHLKNAKASNKHPKKIVDLSRTYIITYSAPFSEKEAADFLVNTNLVEYAEPAFLDEVLYIPNDPAVQSDISQFYLKRYKAYEAWDVTKGDSNTVIGIIDTGVRFSHADLKDNLKYNMAELNGIAGVDDDNDGYKDNIRGWDFGDNDNNPDATASEHGTSVAGMAAATTDNNVGMAGTGFKCKYVPLKASSDASGGSISQGYQAIYYAANHGIKVINLSWGGPGGFSQNAQDVINYAALTKDVVIIAAAGNSGLNEKYYPASYENVMSVAASDTVTSPTAHIIGDRKADFSTYNYRVDICAQGRRVYGPKNNGSYDIGPGTSYSSPQVSGAAALLRSYRPHLNSQQVIQQLRVSGDIVDTLAETKSYKEQYGRRLNMYKSLIDSLIPAVRIQSVAMKNKYGNSAFAGDTVKIYMSFFNFLHATTNCKITLSSSSPYVKFIDSTSSLGAIKTLDSANINQDPFIIVLGQVPGNDVALPFRIQFDDVHYYDYEHFTQVINPSYLTLQTKDVALTVTSDGKLGYADALSTLGKGFTLGNNSLLFESGLMLGINDTTVSDCVRGEISGTVNDNFMPINNVHYVNPKYSTLQSQSSFVDLSAKNPIGILVEQNSYAWDSTGQSKYIIVEYKFTNTSHKTIDSLHAGIFADWDIMNSNKNKAFWNTANKLGYVYSTDLNGLYAGISLLTNDVPSYFALDHSNSIKGDNINPNDGFTSAEKFTTLKKGISRVSAGPGASGGDVSHVVGAKVYNLKPGESKKIAFAIIGAENFNNLSISAQNALAKYKSFNTGAVPNEQVLNYCKGTNNNVSISPKKGTKFKFYSTYPTQPVYTGSIYNISNVSNPDTLYITNVDSLFESKPSKTIIRFTQPNADFAIDPTSIDLFFGSTAQMVNNSQNAASYLWNFGDNATSTDKNPAHEYLNTGTFDVKLEAKDENGCSAEKIIPLTVTNSTITENISPETNSLNIYPIPAEDYIFAEFNNNGQQAMLSIFNNLGKEVINQTISNENLINIDLKGLAPGVYTLKLNNEKQLIIRNFIKR